MLVHTRVHIWMVIVTEKKKQSEVQKISRGAQRNYYIILNVDAFCNYNAKALWKQKIKQNRFIVNCFVLLRKQISVK